MEEYLIITFESTNYAMQTESVLKSFSVKNQIIPTPREISRSCGLSIKTPIENLAQVESFIKEGRIKNKSLYKFSGSGNNKTLEEIRK